MPVLEQCWVGASCSVQQKTMRSSPLMPDLHSSCLGIDRRAFLCNLEDYSGWRSWGPQFPLGVMQAKESSQMPRKIRQSSWGGNKRNPFSHPVQPLQCQISWAIFWVLVWSHFLSWARDLLTYSPVGVWAPVQVVELCGLSGDAATPCGCWCCSLLMVTYLCLSRTPWPPLLSTGYTASPMFLTIYGDGTC